MFDSSTKVHKIYIIDCRVDNKKEIKAIKCLII